MNRLLACTLTAALLAAPAVALARPVVVAHRGMGKGVYQGCVENTLPGFARAFAVGAQMVEFDVRLSADGEVVVLHDDRCRVDGREGLVREFTRKQLLRAVDKGRRIRIPTLDEVLDAHPAHDFTPFFDVEIKIENPADRNELVAKTVDRLRARGLIRSVMVSSFDFETLLVAKHLAPDLRVGYLCEEARAGLAQAVRHNLGGGESVIDAVIPEWTSPAKKNNRPQLSRRFIHDAHGARILVGVYTVNDPAEMRRLAGAGLDFLCTDRAARALRVYGYKK